MQSEEVAIKLHWLTRKNISPLQFALSFLILVGIPFTLWSMYVDKNMSTEVQDVLYVTYLQNISWSLSLLVIFPLFLGLSLHFYNKYPGVLQYIYNTTATAPDKAIFHNLCKKIDRSVNHKVIPIAGFLVSIIFTAYIYINYLSICDVISWMTYGPYLTNFCNCGDHLIKGFTNRGIVAFIIQIMLTTWILIFAVRSLLFIRGLYDLFNSKEKTFVSIPFTLMA